MKPCVKHMLGVAAMRAMGSREMPDLTREELAHARRRLGLTQAEFAERCGLSLRTYQALERGTTRLRPVHGHVFAWVVFWNVAEGERP